MDNGYLHWKTITINCMCPKEFEPIIKLLVLLMRGTRTRAKTKYVILKQKIGTRGYLEVKPMVMFRIR